MHPEYPCAHCISATVGQVLQSELGDAVGPLAMVSPTLPGVTRRWDKVSDLVEEVSNARIWSGVHYRFSAEVGEMGKEIGQYAVTNYLHPCDRHCLCRSKRRQLAGDEAEGMPWCCCFTADPGCVALRRASRGQVARRGPR